MSVLRTPDFGRTPVRFNRPHLAFVEGPDDSAFVAAEIVKLGTADDWHVHFVDGKATDWKGRLEIALDDAWFREHGRSIALIRDADNDAKAAFAALAQVFQGLKLPVPASAGVVASSPRWRVGAYVFPDGTSPGALEDLLLESISDPKRIELAKAYVSEVTRQLVAPPHPSKSMLQAYLAGHTTFVKWIPLAMELPHVISVDSPRFDAFRAFLAALSTGAGGTPGAPAP